AAPKGYKITQVFRDQRRVVIEGDANLAVDTVMVYSDPQGEACEGHVMETQGQNALVSFYDCHLFDKIQSGGVLTRSLFTHTENSPPAAPTPDHAEPGPSLP